MTSQQQQCQCQQLQLDHDDDHSCFDAKNNQGQAVNLYQHIHRNLRNLKIVE